MIKLIHPIILAGGSGTRLWPRSREKYPKQFISIFDGKSLFQDTCIRFSDTKLFAPLTIVTNTEHRFLVRDQLREINITDANIVIEPVAKNTLAACLLGAYYIKQTVGDVPMLFTPADHIITEEEALFKSIKLALPFVHKKLMCVFGIKPTSAHTGFGYILGGKKLGVGVFKPESFIEKPNSERAVELITQNAFWNAGMYFSTPSTLLKEAMLYSPLVATPLALFFKKGKITRDFGFYSIDGKLYTSLPSISIDKGIAEQTKKLVLATTDMTWNDLGSWQAFHSHFKKNKDGNLLVGDVMAMETKNSYVESTGRLIATFGIEDTGIIETPDAILVFSLKNSESVKNVVGKLSEKKREEVVTHTLVHRPWGSYEILGKAKHFQSKRLTILPGSELSLQRHTRRAEHWVVVSGIATVTKDDEIFELKTNESTFIPTGVKHRVQNKHTNLLIIIEVQTGKYFGEDDIERFEDTYGRVR